MKNAEENRALYNSCDTTIRKEWLKRMQKANEFFHNEQLSKEELDELQESGMPDFTVNVMTEAIEALKYFCTANNPKWIVVGKESSDTDMATVYEAVLNHIWYISKGKSVFGQVIQDSLVKSVGTWFVMIDPNGDRGNGEVKIEYLNMKDVYVDPHSQDILWEDASFILIKKDMVKRHLINKLPQYKAKI